MDKLYESLVFAQDQLLKAGIESAAIGALAVSAWGRARTTHDVDLKLALDRSEAKTLLDVLAVHYVWLQSDPLGSLQTVGFVFAKDKHDTRVDFLLADLSFDREAVRRAVEVEILPGKAARVCTAEDLVIYKLISTRARDHDDARGVVARQIDSLDRAYVEGWLTQFEQALDDSTLVQTFRDLVHRAR